MLSVASTMEGCIASVTHNVVCSLFAVSSMQSVALILTVVTECAEFALLRSKLSMSISFCFVI